MLHRRHILMLGTSIVTAIPLARIAQATSDIPESVIQRPIPGSEENLPVIGMGTSRTFDVSEDHESMAQLLPVLQAFFNGGGRVIDSSPMYGNAESRVGDLLRMMPQHPPWFAATKVWTSGRENGIAQMNTSARLMNVDRLDLIAVHNLSDWKTQLDTLKQWKDEGKVRYIGITTSHGRSHGEFLDIMRDQPLDFVQFSYNIEDRMAEKEILPLAADKGIATMINRPYERGSLFKKSAGRELPKIAEEIGCDSWGQFYLKFIISHPAVTCVIPATSKVHHMQDNMKANFGVVPNASQRLEMLRVFDSL